MKLRHALVASVLSVLLCGAWGPLYAATDSSAIMPVILLLHEKGIITAEEFMELKERLDPKPVVAEKQVTEGVRPRQGGSGVTVSADAKPRQRQEGASWNERFKFSGDIRVRYQGDYFSDSNGLLASPSNPDERMNTYEDRSRLRLRARLNIDAIINEDVRAKFRLATGNENDPVSTNSTLGGYLDSESFSLNRAYLDWNIPLESEKYSLRFWAGRMANPWLSSDLVWDNDLNFEGLAVRLQRKAYPFGSFATIGAFPIEEVEFSDKDKWLYAAQAGVQYRPNEKVNSKLAVSYYHFDNITGVRNSFVDDDGNGENDFTQPGFQQVGNTLMDLDPTVNDTLESPALAAEFQMLNLTGALSLSYWDPIQVSFLFDIVKNIGFDQDEVVDRAGVWRDEISGEIVSVDNADMGYQVGVEIGYPKIRKFGEWSASLYYKYVEADAVLDAFTDSDFHLGGTNAQGWKLGSNFGLADNIWLTGTWITADEIEGIPFSVDTLQVDLNGRF